MFILSLCACVWISIKFIPHGFLLQNELLRQKLRDEQNELGAERRRREEGVAALTRETIALKHATRHLTAATFHATSCRNRRRCSICIYARHTFANVNSYRDR